MPVISAALSPIPCHKTTGVGVALSFSTGELNTEVKRREENSSKRPLILENREWQFKTLENVTSAKIRKWPCLLSVLFTCCFPRMYSKTLLWKVNIDKIGSNKFIYTLKKKVHSKTRQWWGGLQQTLRKTFSQLCK